MQAYSQFRPTAFDSPGLALPNRADWRVLSVTRNRDSDHLTESNFETTLAELGGEGDDCEVHRFGHWGPGWYEIIIVRPGTRADETAEAVESALSDYPVLDDDDYSRREYEGYCENWTNWGARDFVRALASKFTLRDLTEDSLYDADAEALQSYYESLIPCADCMTDGLPQITRAMRDATRDNLAAFIRAQRRLRQVAP